MMPFSEAQKADTPLTLYAATKKANESMAHSYAHLWNIPTTMFRFFTVYGPWGRPDMALFKFVAAGLEGRPIDVYNHGDMARDFTYVDRSRARHPPADRRAAAGGRGARGAGGGRQPESCRALSRRQYRQFRKRPPSGDSSRRSRQEIGRPIERNYMEMQKGDVPATWADASLLQRLTGYRPDTPVRDGHPRVRALVSRVLQCDVGSRRVAIKGSSARRRPARCEPPAHP